LTVFEIVFADGLELGPSTKRGVLFVFEKLVPRALSKGGRQRLFFYFFLENPVPSVPSKGRRQRRFLIFFKKFFAESPVQLHSTKLGTPELGKFFTELPSVIAGALGKGSFADGPSC
jgi:hypothetical protein